MLILNAVAASPEDGYIATRDEYIHKFEQTELVGQVSDAKELRELERQLRRIIGTVKVGGFSGRGKINLDTLDPREMGFNRIDGLLEKGVARCHHKGIAAAIYGV